MKSRRKILGGAIAAALAFTAGVTTMAPTASAVSVQTVGLVPAISGTPGVSVATMAGLQFAVRAAHAGTFSTVEQWDIIKPSGVDYVFLESRYMLTGQVHRLDASASPNNTTVPKFGDPVGTRPVDYHRDSQRWKMEKSIDGTVSFKNVLSGYTLEYAGPGSNPAFVQKKAAFSSHKFVLKNL
ncbi:RICIN domain-containing protein [Kribbella sp. CA-253562]|uniref:RICIN domain-containing protein n=1 Tax=Kribbella sp. CA-253562 TaxID=3239942 RepID=UPI003D8BC0B5